MKILASIIVLVSISASYGASQKFSVKGRLMCGEAASANTLVKLIDKDFGPDDVLGRVNTGPDGSFQVEGKAGGGLTGIDPVLRIYHKCGGGLNPCARRWRMVMPKKYIVNDNQPSKWFDVGELNLIVKLEHSEDRNCI